MSKLVREGVVRRISRSDTWCVYMHASGACMVLVGACICRCRLERAETLQHFQPLSLLISDYLVEAQGSMT